MWIWIYNNVDWIFNGIGAIILVTIFNMAKRKAGFELTFHFYVLLFVGIVLAFGCDYFLNLEGDWRLRVFVFGLVVLMTFAVDNRISNIKRRYAVIKAVRDLSIDDCLYVQICNQHDEYFRFSFDGSYIEFENRWKNILYVSVGKRIFLHKPYKIYVYKYAYKLVKKRLRSERKV